MIKFKHPQLLTIALTHRSALNEKKSSPVSNERLEFLGDAVLELVVSDYLYKQYPQLPEGQLTQKRAQLVQTKTLAATAKKLKLGEHLIMSKGEKQAGGQQKTTLLANTFEAFVGALYLDQGLPHATQFIYDELLTHIPEMLEKANIQDYKSQLQEKWQKQWHVAPVYKLARSFGPDHRKTFVVNLYRSHVQIAQGSGQSKQAAQQQAAKQALENPAKL